MTDLVSGSIARPHAHFVDEMAQGLGEVGGTRQSDLVEHGVVRVDDAGDSVCK